MEKKINYWTGAHTKHKLRYHIVWVPKYIVQILKGGTSRILRKQFPDLDEFLWGDSFWADGYFAETVGVLDEQMIRKYIREQ